MARFVLWGLNRCARWAPESLRKALSVPRFLRSPLHDVVMGDRSSFHRDDQGKVEAKPHALQYETERLDEYFVPIPVKAIGDPATFRQNLKSAGVMGPEQEARFDAFLAAYPQHFANDAWRSYWTPRQKVSMFTRKHVGFYEIVRNARAPDQRAVLVGYSQGGLIAHFLAWMDENFVTPEARAIAGVITVQAPNAGSPLADGTNADNVARGVFEALFGALGYPARPDSAFTRLDLAINNLTRGRSQSQRHFDIQALAELIDAAIADAEATRSAEQLNVMLSARKWMTGLCASDYVTAFDDLNTAHLDTPNSVLALVNQGLRRTLHGAVIGTDNQLGDIVRETIGGLVFNIASRVVPALTARLVAAQLAYSSVAMDELVSGEPLPPNCAQLARQFREGASVLGPKGQRVPLAARAHDFIIPSISQAVGPRGPDPKLDPAVAPYFLGNLINPDGTHISGAEEDGDSDVEHVTTLLEEMGRRLAITGT